MPMTVVEKMEAVADKMGEMDLKVNQVTEMLTFDPDSALDVDFSEYHNVARQIGIELNPTGHVNVGIGTSVIDVVNLVIGVIDVGLSLLDYFQTKEGLDGELIQILKRIDQQVEEQAEAEAPQPRCPVILGRGWARTEALRLEGMCEGCRRTAIELMKLRIEPARADFDSDRCWDAVREAGT